MLLKDLFVKLTYPFRNDSFILDRKYVVGGPESELNNVGSCMCVLKQDAVDTLTRELPDIGEIVMVEDIAAVKTNKNKGIKYDVPEAEKYIASEKIESINEILGKVGSWDTLNLSEKEFDDFFNKGLSLDMFADDKRIPTVKISKAVFPMLSEKTVDNFYFKYLYLEDADLNAFVTRLEHEYFTLYNILQYITL